MTLIANFMAEIYTSRFMTDDPTIQTQSICLPPVNPLIGSSQTDIVVLVQLRHLSDLRQRPWLQSVQCFLKRFRFLLNMLKSSYGAAIP